MKKLIPIFIGIVLFSAIGCVDKHVVPDTPFIIGQSAVVTDGYYAYHKKKIDITKKDFIKRDSNGDLKVFSSGAMELFLPGDIVRIRAVVLNYAKVSKGGRAYWVPKSLLELK